MEHLCNDPEDDVNACSQKSLPITRNSSRRILTILSGVVVLAALIYSINSTKSRSLTASSPGDNDKNLTELTLDLSLLAQQLDSTFGLLLQRIDAEKTLSAQDQVLLETWLEFDERFIGRVQNREALKYERVNAHLRMGNGFYLLKTPSQSISHFESAIGLLDELVAENPSIVAYQLDQSDAYAGLGLSMYAAGRVKEARDAIDDSIRLLTDPRYPPTPGRDQRVAELYQQKEAMFAPIRDAQ